MLQNKQIDRMLLKVKRLSWVYESFLIEERINPVVFLKKNGKSIKVSRGYKWGKDFLCATFEFTAEGLTDGKKYYVYAETGGVEHQISVNGKRLGMLDFVPNAVDSIFRIHKYSPLDGLKNGDMVCLDAYYSHTFPGTMPYHEPSTFSLDGLYEDRAYVTIELVTFNEPLRAFSEKLKMLNSHYDSLNDGFAKANAEKVYEKLFTLLPMEKKCPDEDTLIQAVNIINNYFEADINNKPFVGIVGHSHLDTAWLWTVEETKRKLLRTVSNAVTLLNKYPEYKFFMSTVLYLKWIEDMDPDLFSEVSRLIKEGRFEPNGSSWVECDGNLTGGESMCRHFLRGKRYLREKFDYESDTFWLPDTFGYSAALPQILKGCNIDYFLTTKLSWNDTNQFPYENFVWMGIDGSKIPVHFNSIQSWASHSDIQTRLNNVKNPRESDAALIAYGFGDGGGGPSAEMVRDAIETEKSFTAADVKHTTVSDFMKRVSNKELPTYFGELYLELHRGTYTMMHRIKQNNRRLEEAMHDAELVSVFSNDRDAKGLTDELYDVLLLNQFHDILPGTCIKEANDIAIAECEDAIARATKYIKGARATSYFNTLPFSRTELLPSKSGQEYVNLNGEFGKYAFYKFDAFGYGKRVNIGNRFTFDGENITTPHLRAKLKDGVLTSLVYEGREYVNGAFGRICVAENVPYIYDNWDIDADYKLKEIKTEFVSQEQVSIGDCMLVIRVKHKITEGSFIETDIRFSSDSALVRFDNKLTITDKHILVRSYFDTTIHSAHYNSETQFGYVERNSYPRDLSDIAKFEVCAHKWTDFSEKSSGISLLSDTKYGVSSDGSTLGITLHKGGTHPDDSGDTGVSFFSYGLLPHKGALGIETVRSAYAFNYAPRKTSRKNLSAPFTFTDGTGIVIETVKHGEDSGVVLRLYEALGDTSQMTIAAKGRSIVSCNILEDEKEILSKEGIATLTFAPFEIKTIKLI